jgi:hypothetical protein
MSPFDRGCVKTSALMPSGERPVGRMDDRFKKLVLVPSAAAEMLSATERWHSLSPPANQRNGHTVVRPGTLGMRPTSSLRGAIARSEQRVPIAGRGRVTRQRPSLDDSPVLHAVHRRHADCDPAPRRRNPPKVQCACRALGTHVRRREWQLLCEYAGPRE